MRETYSTLLQTTQDLCIDPETSSKTALSASSAFLARQLNDTIQYLYGEISNYKTQPLPKTFSTVASQTYYHIPSGLIQLESLTIAIGDVNYPLRPINSQATWDKFQQLDITSSDVPQYYFMRQYDFGIFPQPGDVYTGTIVGNFLPQRMSVVDYDAGTVVVSQNDATVTGTNTVFTAAMVGRWFCEADSSGNAVGRWYKITSFSTTTSIELETVFEEVSLSGASYLIAQTPEIPEEMHQYIPFRAAANYYATLRRDPNQAQALMNYFFTGDYANPNRGGGIKGGILGIINRYKNTGRSNTQINRLHKANYNHWRDERWASVLSE